MEHNAGLRRILGKALFYRLFQTLVGADFAARWLTKNLWKVEEGMTVVDVGCGPARLRNLLPKNINYFGFDPNESYIQTARQTATGEFFVGVMPDFLREMPSLSGKVDLVICSGVLHHLTVGQMSETLSGVRSLLKEGGRFSALEPTWLVSQDWLSRWVLSQDRGKNIMLDSEWRAEISRFFEYVDIRVANNLIRIPYIYVLISSWKRTTQDIDPDMENPRA